MSAPADVEREVDALLRLVLKLPPEASAPLVRRNLERWDSLKHIELMFALEERFDVQFGEDELARLDSAAAIVAAVLQHRAS